MVEILPKFELIQAFMVVLVTCKNEDPIKNEGSRPVYIESCACVVKDAVKCSFECLSVVHHTCRKHNSGVGDEEITK